MDITNRGRTAVAGKGWLRTLFALRPEAALVQGFRFVVTGVFTAGLDVAVLILLVERFGVHYLVAACVAFVVAVTLNYVISRAWVFLSGRYRAGMEFMGFFLTSSAGLGINQVVLWILVDNLDVDYRLSKLASVLVVTTWNFTTKKYLIFRA